MVVPYAVVGLSTLHCELWLTVRRAKAGKRFCLPYTLVALSRLVLRHGALELRRGEVRATGFLTQALREELGASPRTLRSDRELTRLTLDHGRSVTLEPDLTWWDGPACTFVGDAKYKNLTGHHVPNSDLYQMLS